MPNILFIKSVTGYDIIKPYENGLIGMNDPSNRKIKQNIMSKEQRHIQHHFWYPEV